jgi:hypothetical protein
VNTADKLRPGTDQALRLLHVRRAIFPDRDEPQLRAGRLSSELPGNEVGVVLGFGKDDLVPLVQVLAAPGVGYEVYRLGGAAGEE